MEMHAKLVLPIVIISALVACSPTQAWYKQVAGPSYYSVGRASGLLSGIRRSPYTRRAELDSSNSDELATNSVFPELTRNNFILKTMVSGVGWDGLQFNALRMATGNLAKAISIQITNATESDAKEIQ